MKKILTCLSALFFLTVNFCQAQMDSSEHHYKNVIRYNLSGGLFFGIDKYIVFGYERVLSPHRSFSINVGSASLPKLTNINTDSFSVSKDRKRSGFNVSADYRFYLAHENKYDAPHGLYIGPYYSYSHFTSGVEWDFTNSSAGSHVNTDSKFTINTVGFELGYQFILWKRFALDLVMVGPGVGFYNYKATFESNVDPADKQQILDGLKQLVTQKFPGMNFVFNDKEVGADGVMKTTTIGYRYIVHIGFAF